jgi:hypothetical protein
MSSKLFREFQCDYMYGQTIACLESIIVPTSSSSYGTNNSKEDQLVREAGWGFGNAYKVYCPEHKDKQP